jgi:hypothetical protein
LPFFPLARLPACLRVGTQADSRTNQLFITYVDGVVGKMPWETQIGTVVEGLEHVDAFYKG